MSTKGTILVTGGTGYIGSHTVVALIQAGYQPIIIDNLNNSISQIVDQIELLTDVNVPFFEGDIRNERFLNTLFSEHTIQAVIHFAAFKAVGESVEKPLEYYENNISGLISLLKVMKENHVNRIIFSSSCTVYGIPKDGFEVTEKTELGTPNSPYGWTKWMAEQILRDCAFTKSISPIMLRYFNPVGAHESGLIGELPQGIPNNILPYMTQTAAGLRDKLTVFGSDYPTADGTCIRDYIHVMDLAEAHVKALAYEGAFNTFNLGTGSGTSVLELIAAFEKALGTKMNWTFGPKREGDVAAIFAKVDLAEKELEWNCSRTVEQAIQDAWKWEKYRLEHGL